MATQNQGNENPNKDKEPNLKGTLISVWIVGACLLVAWVGALMLFLAR